MTNQSPDALIERLATESYAVAEGYFDLDLCAALQLEAEALSTDPAAIEAGIGRGAGHASDVHVRNARIGWMDHATPAQTQFLVQTELLRVALNRQLFLGLIEFEAQLAITPVGGFYARHLDSFQGLRNRVVSLVAYLNDEWHSADGGYLRIWPPGQADTLTRSTIDIMPKRATLVLLLSEEVPHEVLPSCRSRASVAGWFRGRAD